MNKKIGYCLSCCCFSIKLNEKTSICGYCDGTEDPKNFVSDCWINAVYESSYNE